MLDFIFAVLGVFVILGLLFSTMAPELTVGFFIKDKSYHTKSFAVTFYFIAMALYAVLNVVVSAIVSH